MTMLPERQNSTVTAIFKHYEKVAEAGQRPHLGASEIGGECERALWLSFRWAKQPDFDGRILRLFESGNLAEPRLIENLRAIGVEVSDRDEDGNQWRFQAIGGHFGGSMDGAALGLPEAPKTWHVLEFKTANAKSFAAMQKKGVKDSKNQHWVQMQLYMGWAGLDRAMYMVVNKDTDDIYAERIEADPAAFKAALAKAERIITAPEPAIPLGETAAAFVCKFCRFKGQCHETEAPQVNCRTCAHATPELGDDARWSCAEHKKDLTVDEQRAGCRDHRHIPVLLGRFAELVDANENNLLTYKNKLTGTEFQQPVYGSQEITDCQDKRMLGDEFTTAMKIEMDATIVPNSAFEGMTDDIPWKNGEMIITGSKQWKK
jgi:hypothetical protein